MCNSHLMALYTLDELVAYQLSMDLKTQVLELIYNSPAQHDTKLAGQISDAASSVPSNISEGFYRFNPAEFAQFVKYSRGSLQEVRTRLPDGVAKRHYTQADIEGILALAERLARVLAGLYFSLKRQAEARRAKQGTEITPATRPTPPPSTLNPPDPPNPRTHHRVVPLRCGCLPRQMLHDLAHHRFRIAEQHQRVGIEVELVLDA